MCINIQDVEQLLIRILKPIITKLEKMDKMQSTMDAIQSTLKKELEILRRDNVDLSYLRKQFDRMQTEAFEIVTQKVSPIAVPNQQRDYWLGQDLMHIINPPQFQNPLQQALPQAFPPQALPPNQEDQAVYKSANGEVYHKQNCQHKNSFTSSLSIAKAQQMGLRPCRTCHKQYR